MSLTPELYDIIVKIVDDRVKEIKVTREAFDKLSETVAELVEAQKRTDEQINKLIEVQKRSEERLTRLEKTVAELAEAQKRSEERLTRLEKAVARLEHAVAELAEAQKRSEERLTRLENAVDKLSEATAQLSRSVGSLSATIGFGLEDIARVVVPGWLLRHENIVVDDLERKFIEVDGKLIEVNLYGEGTKDGERITVVGECKTRIYESEVKKFVRTLSDVKKALKGQKIYPLMFGFLIHPSAEGIAKKHGITLIVSYAR